MTKNLLNTNLDHKRPINSGNEITIFSTKKHMFIPHGL